jgi:hypothetical protein
VLNDDAHVARRTCRTKQKRGFVPDCSPSEGLSTHGDGAEILWHPSLGASYGILYLCGIVSSGALIWHKNSITKERILDADNEFFYLYLQVCDFMNSKPKVLCVCYREVRNSARVPLPSEFSMSSSKNWELIFFFVHVEKTKAMICCLPCPLIKRLRTAL